MTVTVPAANLCPACLARIEDHPGACCPMELERQRRERQEAARRNPARPTTFWNKYGG